MVAIGGGAECRQAACGGGGSERTGVIEYYSPWFRVTVLQFGVYCAIGEVFLMLSKPLLNLTRFCRTVVAYSPSFEIFEVFNYYVVFNFWVSYVKWGNIKKPPTL
jgi:hypothetical protein